MNNNTVNEVQHVTVDELKNILDAKGDCILLDVRTAGEFERGHIEGSNNIPLDKLNEEITTNIPDTFSRIYVICFSGSRSIYAVQTLQELGYSHVFDVSQGLLAWRVKGYPVV